MMVRTCRRYLSRGHALGIRKKMSECTNDQEMRDVAGRLCRNYLYGAWKHIDPSQLVVRRISGGLSNLLYSVALPDDLSKLRRYHDQDDDNCDEINMFKRKLVHRPIDEPRRVMIRLYGQVHGDSALDATVMESVIFTLLSERRLGPKLHGVFQGGRIEEYIPARSLQSREMSEPSLSMKIAEKIAQVHKLELPLNKQPTWMWDKMSGWVKQAKSEMVKILVENRAKNEDELKMIKFLQSINYEAEIEWLKKYVASIDSPVVVCHNDLQGGNILLVEDLPQPEDEDIHTYPYTDIRSHKENTHTFLDHSHNDSMSSHISDTGEPKLVLIDFEYCAYNYRGYDLANHFAEWSFDYSNPGHPFYYELSDNSPTLEQKEIFLRQYLKHYMTDCHDKDGVPTIDAVNQLLEEVDAFALPCHLLWSLWSIANSPRSQIPFGYWEFAMSRFETYKRLKQEVIKKEKYGMPQKRKICEVDI